MLLAPFCRLHKLILSFLVQKLYKYIAGNNADNVKIDMTSPVLIFEHSSDGFKSAEKDYTVAFYLPKQFQVLLRRAASASLIAFKLLCKTAKWSHTP